MGKSLSSVETILKSINDINSDSFETDGDRANTLLAAYALVSRLETPWETVSRIVLNEPFLAASLKILLDIKLFERWQEKGNMAESCDNLARMVNSDPSFLGHRQSLTIYPARILCHLAANNLLEEVSTNMYKPTKLTNSLLQSKYGEWINWLFDNVLPSVAKMPEFYQKTGYKSSTDPGDGLFQYVKGYKGDLFKYLADNPREGESFNHYMGTIIPIEDLLSGVDSESPLVVDIGGNLGHDLDKFRVAYPDTAPRLYLQDLPEVIERSTCPDPVNKMAHDFFQPQPVKDARIYYIHAVLHDWPDEHARKILEMLRDALKPGYSHLLIHDYVVPDQSAHP
ncbi:hypothetical protein N7493_002290 [Penicillium malachiteum]|uniref:O-methyltransferase C-terminal domain-containing protein n=1 Tax=Penicillium malachiteum TaxID=1324776 RepID=A0AAD6HRM0_9EURO|nr:hypothetical protein N7493_002290 [Penicillium malachiteum]